MAPFPSPAAVREDSCISSSLEGSWYKLCRQSGTLQVVLRCLIFFFLTTAGDPPPVAPLGTESFAHSFHILFPFVNRLLCLCISTLVFHIWQLSYCVTLQKSHPLSWSLNFHLQSWNNESHVINHKKCRLQVLVVINMYAIRDTYNTIIPLNLILLWFQSILFLIKNLSFFTYKQLLWLKGLCPWGTSWCHLRKKKSKYNLRPFSLILKDPASFWVIMHYLYTVI